MQITHSVLFSNRTGHCLIKSISEKKCSNFFHVSPFSDSYKSIVEFIDAQFEAYLQEELKIKRTLHSYHDTRIHACLYFIAPTGHSLKSLDLVTMKKLDSKVSFTSSNCYHQPEAIFILKVCGRISFCWFVEPGNNFSETHFQFWVFSISSRSIPASVIEVNGGSCNIKASYSVFAIV